MSVIHLNKNNFDSQVLQSDVPVLVDFFATWCGPCKMIAPVLEEINKEAVGFKVFKVDVDENPELAQRYNIMSIPTLITFKNGKVYKKELGFKNKAALLNMLK